MKTALVTGASSGIGREIARELSRRGWRLLLVARRRDQLGTPCRLYVCDISREENCYWLYERAKEQDVTLLVNGAGFGLYGKFAETDLDRELEMIDVNIKAVHILTKLFLRDFMQKNEGRILNIASSAGFLPGPLLSTYYATKNYVVRLSEAIYEELHEAGSPVTISCLCPGPVETEFNEVAGAHSAAKGLSCEQVAKQAVEQTLAGKLLIIPGKMVRLGAAASRLVPDKPLMRIVRSFQEKKG